MFVSIGNILATFMKNQNLRKLIDGEEKFDIFPKLDYMIHNKSYL